MICEPLDGPLDRSDGPRLVYIDPTMFPLSNWAVLVL